MTHTLRDPFADLVRPGVAARELEISGSSLYALINGGVLQTQMTPFGRAVLRRSLEAEKARRAQRRAERQPA